jgi:hypothetical protein
VVSLLLIAMLPQVATPMPMPTPTPAYPISLLKVKQGAQHAPAQAQSLADIAKRIKLNIPSGQKAVLNNETIKTLSQGVELTTAAPGAGGTSRGASGVAPHQEADKAAWQHRYQDARAKALYWSAEVKRLEGESAKLQADFYSRDDPAYRDGVVKPAWDKALSDLERARKEAEAAQLAPDRVLAAAQREGAEPGWFRGLPDPQADSGAPPTPTPKGAKPARVVKVEPLH